jgi:hypothetical protein
MVLKKYHSSRVFGQLHMLAVGRWRHVASIGGCSDRAALSDRDEIM